MRARRLLVACPCFILVVATLACSSPPNPSGSTAGEPFAPVRRTLAERGAGPEYASYSVEQRDSAYVRGFHERASSSEELRELVFHGVYHPEHPKAAGALQVDVPFLARASDPRPYAEYDIEEMVELARAVQLKLRGLDDVKWFLHGEHDALVQVHATADATRFEFRRNKSGETGAAKWRALIMDDAGVPFRIE